MRFLQNDSLRHSPNHDNLRLFVLKQFGCKNKKKKSFLKPFFPVRNFYVQGSGRRNARVASVSDIINFLTLANSLESAVSMVQSIARLTATWKIGGSGHKGTLFFYFFLLCSFLYFSSQSFLVFLSFLLFFFFSFFSFFPLEMICSSGSNCRGTIHRSDLHTHFSFLY